MRPEAKSLYGSVVVKAHHYDMAGTLLCGNNLVEWKKSLCIVEICVLAVLVSNE